MTKVYASKQFGQKILHFTKMQADVDLQAIMFYEKPEKYVQLM